MAVNSFKTNQNQLLAALEKASGKKWEIEKSSAAEAGRVGKEKLAQGDFSGVVPAIIGLVYSGNEWAQGHGTDNKLLGLSQDEDLESVVAAVLKGDKV